MEAWKPYDRAAAVAYAHQWAMSRNPAYLDYEYLGGDCSNFASQVLYAGSGVMDYTPVYGWYYRTGNDKAPAWTGVEYLYRYLTRSSGTLGPVAVEVTQSELEPGDIIQLSFDGVHFSHTPVVVSTTPELLVAAHSYNSDNRPLHSYTYKAARFLHILGVRARVGD